MHIKFVTLSYHSTTSDDEIQTQMSGICNTLLKNGFEVVTTSFQYDNRHGKIMFMVQYK